MPERLPAAVFFDMDGLLVDTEPLWMAAEQEVMQRLGASWGAEHQSALVGGSLESTVAYMIEMAGRGDPDDIAAGLLREMSRRLAAGPVTVNAGALELLDALTEVDVPTALVSASYREHVDLVLKAVGTHRFGTTVAGDEVVSRKPAPDGYLLAAQRLSVRPRDCVVLEDSLNGARAGQAAGCLVVVVPSVVDVEPAPGRLVRGSLAELSPQWLGAQLATAVSG